MPSIPAPVQFNFLTPVTLTNRKKLQAFIRTLFKKEKKVLAALTYIFCSDNYLLAINKQYLQHDYYTDIITFDLSQPGSGEVTGEIYISIDRVKENAHNYHTTQSRELHRVIFHGALHLCGYKDKTPKAQTNMRAAEDKYLTAYFKP